MKTTIPRDALIDRILADTKHALKPVIKTKCSRCGDPAQGVNAPDGQRDLCKSCAIVAKHRGRCSDCGEVGERTGHQTCQYPQDHE